MKSNEDNECKCHPDDLKPCSLQNNCYNAVTNIECDPKLCPCKDKCNNQNFRRGVQFKFSVKMTESKGFGLFAQEEISKRAFVIEFMGEVIDQAEFNQRFSRALVSENENYYFLSLGNQLYIDPTNFGNEARFINHSCNPNVQPEKWIVYSNGHGQTRVGLYALRNILPVGIYRINSYACRIISRI